ncbi:MAG TPA: ATP-binding protein [Thermoplasmata archaeon]|nr:ATP-binding protein [Thermoplasmata archaeon]
MWNVPRFVGALTDPDRPLGVALLDHRGRLKSANARMIELLGGEPNLLSTSLLDHAAFEDAGLRIPLERALREQWTGSIRATRFRSGEGKEVLLDAEFHPVVSGKGELQEVILLLADVTAGPFQAGRASMFYHAFLHSSNAIEITDREGLYVDVNPAFERIYGYRREEIVGQSPRLISSPKTPRALFTDMWAALTDPARGGWGGELTNVDRNGRERPVFLEINTLRDAQGEVSYYIGVATDLTELKLLQLQSIRAERLASLGQLAAGVAHELNTPLANIMLIAESLQRRAPSSWVSSRAEAVIGQVDVASQVVAGLLDFGRYHPPITEEVELAPLLEEAVQFVRGKHSDAVEIVREVDLPGLRAPINRIQILQVLVNLLNNAYDAMNDRGTIRLETKTTPEGVEIAITDSGPGIPDPVLPHIFEPFFTTKTDGKGTGLGLAICHGIVTGHGGTLSVATSSGQGTTFTIRLPLVRGKSISPRTAVPVPAPPSSPPPRVKSRTASPPDAHPRGRRRSVVP